MEKPVFAGTIFLTLYSGNLKSVVYQGRLIVEASDHTQIHHFSVGLLWTGDQPGLETSDITQHSQEADIRASGGIRTPQSQQAGGLRSTPETALQLGWA